MTAETPFPYRPATEAPAIAWPGGAPVAVWVAVNIEHYPIDVAGLSIVPVTAGNVPDPMNYGWRDYGARVGTFSLIDLLDELGVPVTAPVHSEVCARYPQIVEAGMQRNWVWMAHGAHNAAMHVDLDVEDERRMLRECVEAVGDRNPAAHRQSMLDMQTKYADIVALDATIEYLAGL